MRGDGIRWLCVFDNGGRGGGLLRLGFLRRYGRHRFFLGFRNRNLFFFLSRGGITRRFVCGIVNSGDGRANLNLVPLLGKEGDDTGCLGQPLLSDLVGFQFVDRLINLDIRSIRNFPTGKDA